MKGLIATGGRGVRLRPITHTYNKHLIPIANKPLVLYPFESIVKTGVKEIGVVVNETGAEIKKFLGNGSRWGVKLTYITQYEPEGTAHVIKIAKKFLGKDKFIYVLGDNIFLDELGPFVKEFENSSYDAIALVYDLSHKNKNELRRFGIAEVKEDKLIKLHERPEEPPSSLVAVGGYLFSPRIWEAFEGPNAIKKSIRGELETPDAINFVCEQKGDVRVRILSDWWNDPGVPDDFLDANRVILERICKFENKGKTDAESKIIGKVNIGEGTVVEKSVLRGPITVGKGCIIREAYIGPYTSVGEESIVERAEVEYTVILKKVHVYDLKQRLEHSLIGDHAVVTHNTMLPRSLRLQISDHSEVYLP